MKNKKFILQYHIMILIVMVFLVIFSILPLFGNIMAFQKFVPAKGFFKSEWVGLKNIVFIFQIPDSKVVIGNTIYIAVLKTVADLFVPLMVALLLNEVKKVRFKRSVQTVIYMPYFLSWVILGGILKTLLASDGAFNNMLQLFGVTEAVPFFTSNTWFRPMLIVSHVWKGFGYGTIIYLAAITGVDPGMYEAAAIDGAGRWRRLWNITLPSIKSTVILLATLSLGNVLNAGFEQILNLYNPLVYDTADVIDTYVYRMGLLDMQFSQAAAVGLLKSVISLILIVISYALANRVAKYEIF